MQYYAYNQRNITLIERWRMRRSVLQFLLAQIGRLLGMRIATSPRERPQSIQRLEAKDLPDAIRARFTRSVADAEQAGAQFCFLCRVAENVLDRKDESRAAALVDPGGLFWAVVGRVRVERGAAVAEKWVFRCVTRLVDDSFIETSNYRQRVELPSGREVHCIPDAEPRTIIAAHRGRLEALGKVEVPPITPGNLEATLLARAQRHFDEMVARGLLVPIEPPAPRGRRS